MKHFSATEVKNRFGEVLEEALREPVVIHKNGRDIAVLISKAEFDRRDRRLANKTLIQKLHEESIERYGDVYRALAK